MSNLTPELVRLLNLRIQIHSWLYQTMSDADIKVVRSWVLPEVAKAIEDINQLANDGQVKRSIEFLDISIAGILAQIERLPDEKKAELDPLLFDVRNPGAAMLHQWTQQQNEVSEQKKQGLMDVAGKQEELLDFLRIMISSITEPEVLDAIRDQFINNLKQLKEKV